MQLKYLLFTRKITAYLNNACFTAIQLESLLLKITFLCVYTLRQWCCFLVFLFSCLTMTEPFRYSQIDVESMGHETTADGTRRSRRQTQIRYVSFVCLNSHRGVLNQNALTMTLLCFLRSFYSQQLNDENANINDVASAAAKRTATPVKARKRLVKFSKQQTTSTNKSDEFEYCVSHNGAFSARRRTTNSPPSMAASSNKSTSFTGTSDFASKTGGLTMIKNPYVRKNASRFAVAASATVVDGVEKQASTQKIATINAMIKRSTNAIFEDGDNGESMSVFISFL